MLGALGFVPGLRTLQIRHVPVSTSFGDGVALPLTFRFRSLSFLIRRAVHSPAVAPELNSSRGFFATASATFRLFSTSGRRTTSLFGRVKNATEYRSYRDWWPGGGLFKATSEVASAVLRWNMLTSHGVGWNAGCLH